jgi:TRAP transporter TAXI family solute receptor
MRLTAGAAALAATASIATLATPAAAQMVGIGSTKGTVVAQMTAAISKVVSEHAGLQMRTQAMGGTQQYIPVVNAGELQFGIGNMFQTYQAFAGIGISKGHKYDNLRLVATLMPFRNGLLVANNGPIKKVSDLKGKRVPSGYKAAPLFVPFFEGFLANGGLTYADVQQVPVNTLRQSWENLMQGSVDVVIAAAGGGPNLEMNSKIDGGIRYLNFDTEGPNAKKTLEMLPKTYFTAMTPAPQFPAIRSPTTIMGYDFMLWAYKGVSDDVVMKVVKALHDHADEVKSSSAVWKTWDPKQMGKDQGPGMDYHPGAVAYYKQTGLWKR